MYGILSHNSLFSLFKYNNLIIQFFFLLNNENFYILAIYYKTEIMDLNPQWSTIEVLHNHMYVDFFAHNKLLAILGTPIWVISNYIVLL